MSMWCTVYITYLIGFDSYIQFIYAISNSKINKLFSSFGTCRVFWVKVFGERYCKGSVIIIGLYHGNHIFGEVANIFIVDQSFVLFHYNKLHVNNHNTYLNGYQVIRTHQLGYMLQDNLMDGHPLSIHRGLNENSNKLYAVLRYTIDCMLG